MRVTLRQLHSSSSSVSRTMVFAHVATCLAGSTLLSSTASARHGSAAPQVIYGDDSRRDAGDPETSDTLREMARGVGMFVKLPSLTPSEDYQDEFEDRKATSDFRLTHKSFGEAFALCEEEPFYEQPTPGFCSGFLVAPDVMVTAGHCVPSPESCEDIAIVFDYTADAEMTFLDKEQVYFCDEVITTVEDYFSDEDYAVIRLDAPVEGRPIFSLSAGESMNQGASLSLIGHPMGLPQKIADDGQVRNWMEGANYFIASLDSYQGNSGSPVINNETGEVEGILVRGETDLVWDAERACRVSQVCEEAGCGGEDVNKIQSVMPFVEPFLASHAEQESAWESSADAAATEASDPTNSAQSGIAWAEFTPSFEPFDPFTID